MRKDNIIKAGTFTIALLLGIAIPFSNPVFAIFLMLLSLLFVFISIGLVTFGLFHRKFKWWYLIGLLPLFVGFGLTTVKREYKHTKAVAINAELEQFKRQNGRYPRNLKEVGKTVEINGLRYETDTLYKEYRLEYLMDKFNREYYDSKSKEWGTLGWND